jgi:adenine deaminase
MDLRVQLSSCVPATGLETSGARLTASDLVAHRGHPQVIPHLKITDMGLVDVDRFELIVA